jgi:hypothetical protein
MNTLKENDNVETKKLILLLTEFLESLNIRFDGYNQIEPLEFRSRDGFSAFDRNRGGMDFISITDNASLIGSGYHSGTSIEKIINDSFETTLNEVKLEYPDLNEEEQYDKTYEIESNDYNGQAFRVRLMYEGNNTLVVHAGWDHDAPYFRWSNKSELEKVIKFKNKRDLKTKLNKLIKKIEKLA